MIPTCDFDFFVFVSMARQTTLFGNVLPKQNKIYKFPRTKYESFINTYVNKHQGRNEDLVKDANKLWRDRKGEDVHDVIDEQEESSPELSSRKYFQFLEPKTEMVHKIHVKKPYHI